MASYILFFAGACPQALYATERAEVKTTESGRIVVKVNNKPFKEVLSLIEKQSKYVFVYNSGAVNLNKKVTLNIASSSINEVMTALLNNTSLSY